MGSFPSVSHHMRLHGVLAIEAPATAVALVRPFSRVDSHVQSQCSTLSEVHTALRALVRLLSRVDPDVLLQMARHSESLGADGTSVSPLLGHTTEVFLQRKTDDVVVFSPPSHHSRRWMLFK